MITKSITTVLLSGFIVGLIYTVMQILMITPLIISAEKYELSEVPADFKIEDSEGISKEEIAYHKYSGNWINSILNIRNFYTSISNIVTAIAFSMILISVFLMRGKLVNFNSGIIWGVAGFSIFSLAPALGLPPELPGMSAAALESRQIWWIGTVTATAVSIGIFSECKTILPKIAALAIIISPHIIGAPHPFVFESNVPAELSAQFAVMTLFTSAFFWLILGGTTGYFYKKFVHELIGDSSNISTMSP